MDLSHLDNQQRLVATTVAGPVLCVASAGSGKTYTLTHRLAWMIDQGIDPDQIVIFTFNRHAADTLKQRLRRLIGRRASAVTAGTFHSVFWNHVLKPYWTDTSNPLLHAKILRDWEVKKLIEDATIHTLNELNALLPVMEVTESGPAINEALKQVATQPVAFWMEWIEARRAHGHLPDFEMVDALNHAEQSPIDAGIILAGSRIYAQYQELKSSMQPVSLDFSDLMVFAYRAMRDEEDVLHRAQTRWQYIMVDEYQDTDALQYEMIRMMAEQHRNLMVVGDDAQSIYGFRGSDVRNLLYLFENFPETQILPLSTNYRSTATIVDLGEKILQHNTLRLPKHVTATPARGQGVPVTILKGHGKVASLDEATQIATQIETWHEQGVSYPDMAVLYRNRFQSLYLEFELTLKGIPYHMNRGQSLFHGTILGPLIEYLRLSQDDHDWNAFEEIFNVPNRYLGHVAWDAVREGKVDGASVWEAVRHATLSHRQRQSLESFVKPLVQSIRHMSPSSAVSKLISTLDYHTWLNKTQDESGDYKNLLQLFTDRLQCFHSIPEFLDILDASSTVPPSKAVSCSTIHGAKGLEWDNVIVMGLKGGVFPKINISEWVLEEERRLLYVAVTRAKRELVVSYPDSVKESPSQFAYEIEEIMSRRSSAFEELVLDDEIDSQAFNTLLESAGVNPWHPDTDFATLFQQVKRQTDLVLPSTTV